MNLVSLLVSSINRHNAALICGGLYKSVIDRVSFLYVDAPESVLEDAIEAALVVVSSLPPPSLPAKESKPPLDPTCQAMLTEEAALQSAGEM